MEGTGVWWNTSVLPQPSHFAGSTSFMFFVWKIFYSIAKWNNFWVNTNYFSIQIGVSGIDMFVMAAELLVLREKEKHIGDTISKVKAEIKELKVQQTSEDQKPSFGNDEVLRKKGKLKNVFKYETGNAYIRFAGLLTFLIPDESSISYEKGWKLKRH